jgi:hypothetical protein
MPQDVTRTSVSDGVVSAPAMCPTTGPTGQLRSLASLPGPFFVLLDLTIAFVVARVYRPGCGKAAELAVLPGPA